MDRAIPVGNRICHARVHKRHEAVRKQRLQEMRPQIDATPPAVCGMKHLKTNWKRDEVLGCKYDQIERDNRHLLQAMKRMATDPKSSSMGSKSAPSLPHMDAATRFPGGPARKTEIARIESENARLLKRLQTIQSEFRLKDLEASHEERKSILRRICQNPLPDMKLKRRVRPTASLEQLSNEDGLNLQGPGAVAQDSVSPSGLRYVLKEHMLIGGTAYFVEMATDGQTLAVSAYNPEVQDTLELLVNEENHRKLLFESDSDYSQIAGRVRIRDDQLVIIAPEALET